ncbi:hypothetical protein V8C43DRAFT_295769 [Trichoderma afarasin]
MHCACSLFFFSFAYSLCFRYCANKQGGNTPTRRAVVRSSALRKLGVSSRPFLSYVTDQGWAARDRAQLTGESSGSQ